MLDSKRSNAINIGLTVLPPPRTIKTAILNFDEYALTKEGIEVSADHEEENSGAVDSYSFVLLVKDSKVNPSLSLSSECFILSLSLSPSFAP